MVTRDWPRSRHAGKLAKPPSGGGGEVKVRPQGSDATGT